MMFKHGVRGEIRLKLGCPFFILPSSTHEVLILPDNGELNPKELLAMVKEVNRTEVAAEDVLSDHLYRCDLYVGVHTVL